MDKCEKCGRDMTFGNKALFGKDKNRFCRFCLLEGAKGDYEQKKETINKVEEKLHGVDNLDIKCLRKAEVIGFNKIQLGKLQDFFENTILDDEEVLFFINGEANNNSIMTKGIDSIFGNGDHLIVTNDRILISKKGMKKIGSGSLGQQLKSYYYEDITAVDISSSLGKYWLEITSSGQTGKQGGFVSKLTNENNFEFTKGIKKEMNKVNKTIQTKIRNTKRR